MAEGRGKEKMIAGILGILLGGLGIHHFYLGSNTAGIILLAVGIVLGTITCGVGYGLAALVGLVEGIMLLIMPDDEFNRRYNQRTPGSTEFVFMKPKP
jgi:TM2 domain-containing membrane protein YozV